MNPLFTVPHSVSLSQKKKKVFANTKKKDVINSCNSTMQL